MNMKIVVWALILALVVLHQDIWYWHNPYLVMGFLPIGLLYHMVLSIAAAASWWLATAHAWPDDVDHAEEEA